MVVYEQAAQFLPTVGAGFGLSANGQIVLASLGIDSHQEIGQPFDRVVRLTKDGTAVLQESNVFEQLRQRTGFGISGLLRKDLIDILVAPLLESKTILYSHKLTTIEQQHDKVELKFANGQEDTVDLVVGADGIHSTVAELLSIDPSPPIYSNANIFYGKIPDPDLIEWENPYICQDKTIVYVPGGVGEFLVFPSGPDSRKVLIWATTYQATDAPSRQQGGRTTEEWQLGNVQELDRFRRDHYPNPKNPIHELARHTAPENLLHFGLYYRRHKRSWFRDRVVLLGDSCHATLPYVGQGANQAMEDAIVLSDSLLEHPEDHHSAFTQYYNRRFTRTKRIVQVASILDKLFHSQKFMAKAILELFQSQIVTGGILFRQLKREIIQECPVKDYKRFLPK